MFTGIVQDLVPILAVEHDDGLMRMQLELADVAGLRTGASVAVNGVCLTVTGIAERIVSFDIIAETLNTTTLNALEPGQQVNVERSFTAGDEVGGHIVSGHVTGTAAITQRRVNGHDHVLQFQGNPQWLKFVFHKGFIALDGASLTVSLLDLEREVFEVSLIPETLARTTLGQVADDGKVNVEVDAATVSTVETVERLFSDPQWRSRLAI